MPPCTSPRRHIPHMAICIIGKKPIEARFFLILSCAAPDSEKSEASHVSLTVCPASSKNGFTSQVRIKPKLGIGVPILRSRSLACLHRLPPGTSWGTFCKKKKNPKENLKLTLKFYMLAILHKSSSINIRNGPKTPQNHLKQPLS